MEPIAENAGKQQSSMSQGVLPNNAAHSYQSLWCYMLPNVPFLESRSLPAPIPRICHNEDCCILNY